MRIFNSIPTTSEVNAQLVFRQHISHLRPLTTPIRTSLCSLRKPTLRRTFYSKPAEFITIFPQGSLITQKPNIWQGDSYETYVILPTSIRDAIKAASVGQRWRISSQRRGAIPVDFL